MGVGTPLDRGRARGGATHPRAASLRWHGVPRRGRQRRLRRLYDRREPRAADGRLGTDVVRSLNPGLRALDHVAAHRSPRGRRDGRGRGSLRARRRSAGARRLSAAMECTMTMLRPDLADVPIYAPQALADVTLDLRDNVNLWGAAPSAVTVVRAI